VFFALIGIVNRIGDFAERAASSFVEDTSINPMGGHDEMDETKTPRGEIPATCSEL
jgi:hypothetical protein